MDWYVDNVLGNDTYDGHAKLHTTGVTGPKLTMDGVNSAADFTNANNPHNIYVRATGTHYTGNNNTVIVWKAGVANISINRYDTDTGTSRPIFDKGATNNSGRIWSFSTNNSVAIRNMHFIGMAGGGGDAGSYGIIGFTNTAIAPTIEYCIFEQRFSYYGIRVAGNLSGTFTLAHCYFVRDSSLMDDTTVGKGAVHETASGVQIWSVTNNIFENYPQPLRFFYHHPTLAGTSTIDHNSFPYCGRTSVGIIAELGTVAVGNTFVFTNNIISGNSSVGSKGLHYSLTSGSVSPDYNDWSGIETVYSTGSPPTPAHDLSADPAWQGGASTWTDAYIALTYYYAPMNTNYSVILGDSAGSCMGAIYVIAYMPPPVITPTGGNYSTSLTISISSAISGTTIRYTTDGAEPDVSSPTYSASFVLPTSTTVRAKSWKTGYTTSDSASETYAISTTPSTPTPVSISNPSIPGLGALPCFGGSLFNRLKSHLVDDNIYDTSDAAIGITNYMVTFTGNIGDMPVTSLTVYRVYRGETKILATVVPDASGNYSFADRLPHGRASYYGKSSDGKYFSNTMHVHSYYIHVWLCAYATELLTLKQETAQVRQNTKIEDGTDFDGDAITTDGYYLAKNFGQYITARKLEDMTRAEYQQLLLNVLEAYNLGPSVEAIDLICGVFTGELPSLLWYKDSHGFPTTSVRLRVASPPSLNYQWDAASCYLYDKHYTIPAGSGTIGAGLVEYVYVDGTTSPTTVDDRLSVLASSVMPFRYAMSYSDTIPADLVRVDTDGTNVGVSGELYVTLDRFPVSFIGASGTLAPFVSGIPGAFLVPHTSNVDLNMAQEVIDKSAVFGSLTVEYTTSYENIILGVVHAGSSAITGITSCGRPDGGGAVSRDVSVHEHCGEFRIRGSASLPDEARFDLFWTLKDVKPADKKFYIFYENAVTGAYEYYGII